MEMVAPTGWTVVSIAILNAHKLKGHGAKFLCPISLTQSNLATVLVEDDTDVIHLDMTGREDVMDALYGLQQCVTSWGSLLIATGGALKPGKCFYHLISSKWKKDGTWAYDDNEEKEELQLEIPRPDGSFVPLNTVLG